MKEENLPTKGDQSNNSDKQIFAINVNTLITALIAALMGLLCYLGKAQNTKLEDTSNTVISLKQEMISVHTDINRIETKVDRL